MVTGNQCSRTGSRNAMNRDALFLESLQHADMGNTLGCTATEGETDTGIKGIEFHVWEPVFMAEKLVVNINRTALFTSRFSAVEIIYMCVFWFFQVIGFVVFIFWYVHCIYTSNLAFYL